MLRPNVRAAINFEDVEPVSYKKTLAFINNFVINTTQFMNRFSYLCEEKLGQVSKDLQRLEITLAILEAKLASIPGLDQITTPLAEDTVPTTAAAAAVGGTADSSGPVAPPTSTSTSSGPPPPPPTAIASSSAADDDDFDSDSDDDDSGSGGAVSAESSGAPVLTMKDDPRFERYFKMLKMGVLVAQVKQKMQMEGINPNILDTPDAPSDSVVPAAKGEEEWDEDDDDDDDDDE